MKYFKYLLILLVSLTISVSCNNDDDEADTNGNLTFSEAHSGKFWRMTKSRGNETNFDLYLSIVDGRAPRFMLETWTFVEFNCYIFDSDKGDGYTSVEIVENNSDRFIIRTVGLSGGELRIEILKSFTLEENLLVENIFIVNYLDVYEIEYQNEYAFYNLDVNELDPVCDW